jgi:hypothetical protein
MDAAMMQHVAQTQATLRRLNENIKRERGQGDIAFRCECGQLGCNRHVSLDRAQYEAVRADPRRFAVVPGHVVTRLEREIERHAGYAVVETHPHTADFAERTYPRRTAAAER